MEVLGIGPLELIFVLIIALIVLGPNDMVKTGKMLGKWLRQLITSPIWRTVQDTSREISNLPTKLMREAGLEDEKGVQVTEQIQKELNLGEIENEIGKLKHDLSDWTTPPNPNPTSPTPPLSNPQATTQPASPEERKSN